MGRPKGSRDAGSSWHSDYSYKPVPANATMLYALEIPDAGGGDFADLAAAYRALSDERKALEGLRSVNSTAGRGTNPCGGPLEPVERNRAGKDSGRASAGPQHPETGRKGLFISMPSAPVSKHLRSRTGRSQSLIGELFAHTDDPAPGAS